MASKATTIDAYIEEAPEAGRPHLRRLREILRACAPHAEEAMKWGQPFFIEPRFVYAFSASKSHLSFTPSQAVLKHFAEELAGHDTTPNLLRVRYDEPLPEALIRKIARYRVAMVKKRAGDAFWD